MAGGCVWYYPFVLRNNHCKLFVGVFLFAPRFELHACTDPQISAEIEIKQSKRLPSNNQTIKIQKTNQRIKYHFHPTHPIPLQNGIKTIKIPGMGKIPVNRKHWSLTLELTAVI
jgi:hypothetical protein